MTTSSTIPLPSSSTPGVPPPEPAPAVPPALHRARWFEAALVVLVAALAFLLGSFPARNSDLWASLAAGRDLVGGTYSPGADPRLPAGAAANPSWLYDLAVYGVYSLAGGPGLLLCKALLVVGLALVLLRLARTSEARTGAQGGTVPPRTMTGVPAVCTALALVTMGMHLLLQPATVSYLFLALTLWSLRDREQTRRLLPPWPLLLLFVVWANVDDWFVLGLSVVALATTGRALDEKRESAGPSRPAFRPLSWTLALAAVCLVNPAHVSVFRLPEELGWSGTGRVLSPFEPAYFATLGLTPAVLAYYPLLVLGLVSFVLNRRGWSWERFLPWLALAAL